MRVASVVSRSHPFIVAAGVQASIIEVDDDTAKTSLVALELMLEVRQRSRRDLRSSVDPKREADELPAKFAVELSPKTGVGELAFFEIRNRRAALHP
jgi:hypothetical protein